MEFFFPQDILKRVIKRNTTHILERKYMYKHSKMYMASSTNLLITRIDLGLELESRTA